MNIGFVSTWAEVGAAYVTKNYIEALKEENSIFIYPRGLKTKYEKGSYWDQSNVEETPKLATTNIDWKHFKKWIKKNKIEVLFFNEQVNMMPVLKLKKNFPDIKIGTYVDYYTQDLIKHFKWFDFIICNTKRHYSVFKDLHSQVYYVKWGVDVELFTEKSIKKIDVGDEIVFFHSCGWSNRKGTDALVNTFISEDIFKEAKLIIHTQRNLDFDFNLEDYNIEIIHKTVTHPGLYHLGDIYVYPTMLEGLGLTMYEALVSGLPIIVPDNAPMNEIVNTMNGRKVDVKEYVARKDAYYWPLSIVNEQSLAEEMRYYIERKESLYSRKTKIRESSTKEFNWSDRFTTIKEIFSTTRKLPVNQQALDEEIKILKHKQYKNIGKSILELTSNRFIHKIGRKKL